MSKPDSIVIGWAIATPFSVRNIFVSLQLVEWLSYSSVWDSQGMRGERGCFIAGLCSCSIGQRVRNQIGNVHAAWLAMQYNGYWSCFIDRI